MTLTIIIVATMIVVPTVAIVVDMVLARRAAAADAAEWEAYCARRQRDRDALAAVRRDLGLD